MYSGQMRMTGLFSGMDTEAMVTQLMNAESMKYTKLLQRRQTLEWQQEAYRDVATKLREFKDTQLNVVNTSSIYSYSTFNTVAASATVGGEASSAIKVSGGNGTPTGGFSLEVLAAAKGWSYDSKALDSKFTGDKAVDTNNLNTTDSFSISLDGGAEFSISLNSTEIGEIKGAADKNVELAKKINEKLKTRFRYTYQEKTPPPTDPDEDKYGETTTQKVSVEIDGSGNMSFVTAPGYNAKISAGPSSKNLLEDLGFSEGGSTAFSTKTTMADLGFTDSQVTINGKSIGVLATDTIDRFMEKVNGSSAGVKLTFDKMQSKFTLESTKTGEDSQISITDGQEIFEALKFDITGTDSSITGGKPGTDAEFVYNGVKYTRESNSFEIEGVNITLTEEAENTTFDIDVKRDTSKAVEAVKTFVEEYNKLIDVIIGQTQTTRPKSGKYDFYEPLTDEQKEAMSDEEIEKWEGKAKTGLLYRDNILSGITTKMRQMMYTPLKLEDGSTIALYQIGVTTSSDDKSIGKLQIDEDDLTAALEQRPEDIAELFAKGHVGTASNVKERSARMESEGIGARLRDIVDNAVAIDGSISEKAGIVGSPTAYDNLLYEQLSDNADDIETMLDYLERRENYYYNMFARMEQAMNQSNSQMSAITGMLAG